MTTVLSVGNSEGERRCDARCYEARTGQCDCVCGGRYHGQGSSKVLGQVQEDVAGGVFGETIAIAGHRGLEVAREREPDVVRFHERAIRRAIGQQAQLEIGGERG